jgi:hypothetical protein
MGVSMHHVENQAVRIEMSEATLTRLLAEGHLVAADLRCLDRASGQASRP